MKVGWMWMHQMMIRMIIEWKKNSFKWNFQKIWQNNEGLRWRLSVCIKEREKIKEYKQNLFKLPWISKVLLMISVQHHCFCYFLYFFHYYYYYYYFFYFLFYRSFHFFFFSRPTWWNTRWKVGQLRHWTGSVQTLDNTDWLDIYKIKFCRDFY